MQIKVYEPPKEDGNAIYLSLAPYGTYVELRAVDAAGNWVADLLRINEKGIFRVGDVGETDVCGIRLDGAGRLKVHDEDPADG